MHRHSHDTTPRLPGVARELDARILVWLLGIVLATGLPLVFWFDADATAHAAALPAVGAVLRGLHAASSVLLVLGTVAHMGLRVWSGLATWKGVRTGALALLSVSLAVVTGAFAAQTALADTLVGFTNLERWGDRVTIDTWMALGHMLYASLLVVLTVYFHVSRWGWWRLLGSRQQGMVAVLASAVLVLIFGTSVPGGGTFDGATFLVVPPVAGLWAWTALLGLVAYLTSGWLGKRA